MKNDNKKTIIYYIIGTVLMIGLIVFIIKGFRDMVSDQFGQATTTEQTSETEVDIKALIAEDKGTEATSEATTEEVTTEAVTEITTEEVIIETTEELTTADDKSAPVFLVLPQTVEVKQGTPFYILDYVGYADDVDKLPELEFDGEVDTNTTGSYPLSLSLKDKAGHTTNGKMIVKVVTEYSESESKPKEDFETFKATYKNDNTTLGIDVSRWQEDIDFEQVKNAGCDFVIIRIGGFDDGSQYTDKYFKTNIEKAKAAGLKVGIYWHAEENSSAQVKSNVDYMMNVLGGEQLDFPIAYDWEDFSHFPKYAMNLRDINDCFDTFCNAVKAYGYEACLYSSRNFLESVWTNEKSYPVWLANYTQTTAYSGQYFMWQQANTGSIPGVKGDVDFDILYNSATGN